MYGFFGSVVVFMILKPALQTERQRDREGESGERRETEREREMGRGRGEKRDREGEKGCGRGEKRDRERDVDRERKERVGARESDGNKG